MVVYLLNLGKENELVQNIATRRKQGCIMKVFDLSWRKAMKKKLTLKGAIMTCGT